MLTSLRIENFAIVAELELDFSGQMTAFTGETGAGKSIMIDALMLALGERADASVIRANALKCDISASFLIDKDSQPAFWLQTHDVEFPDGEVILRRVIYSEGRSKSYINAQPFPLQKIKELSEMLVDIHGQHEHQTLLQHTTHRQQLDRYANHLPLQNEVAHHYRTCQQLKDALRAQEPETFHEKITLLQYQVDELEALCLNEGEMQALHEEHLLLHHARDYLERSEQITDLLNGDEGANVCKGLHRALQLLDTFPKEPLKTASELLNSALIQTEEAHNEIVHFASRVSLDPERLLAIETRISTLHQAARKYHIEASQLPTHALSLQEELQRLQRIEKEHQIQELQYQEALQAYQIAAMDLRKSREMHAQALAENITKTIQQLGMPKGYLTVDITPLDTPHLHGMDKVEYNVCTNPGLTKGPLSKVVSGGELSRIGLAIHMITAERSATPTLLFDEVDVGIGGATAALIGQLLRSLGERLQIFCVTHQPQVASSAHHHFRVEKHVREEQTFSSVVALNHPEKIDEIARMLGGLTVTEQTRSHALELLELQHA